MDILRCAKCGTKYPIELETKWGEHEQSDGYGSEARCVALVPNPAAPRVASTGEIAQQRCGGRLVADSIDELALGKMAPTDSQRFTTAAEEAVSALVQLTPITPTIRRK